MISLATKLMLKNLGEEEEYYFTKVIENYFETHGVEPRFKSDELKELWFNIKISCLCAEILYESRHMKWAKKQLEKELDLNSKKFENPKFVIKYVE